MLPQDTGFNPTYSELEPTLEQIATLEYDAILEFGAPWCGHCITAEPVVKQFLSQHSNLRHIKIYDGKGKPLGRSFRVKLWPTLILLRNGEEAARVVRPKQDKDMDALLDSVE